MKKQESKAVLKPNRMACFSLILAKSYIANDTVSSVHFAGARNINKTAVYVTNFTKSLYYSGTVKLIGDKQLPTPYIETSFLNNEVNKLTNEGKMTISEPQLPEINSEFKKIFEGIQSEKVKLSDVEKPKDSLL